MRLAEVTRAMVSAKQAGKRKEQAGRAGEARAARVHGCALPNGQSRIEGIVCITPLKRQQEKRNALFFLVSLNLLESQF